MVGVGTAGAFGVVDAPNANGRDSMGASLELDGALPKSNAGGARGKDASFVPEVTLCEDVGFSLSFSCPVT